jgi:hypothetical protein
MDSLITAAARALATGDPLGALKRVALRNDAPALALRGIAMAQLGDLVRAKQLLRQAARAFGAKEPLARARCVVAEAEVALASRDLGFSTKALDAARAILSQHGDELNAAHAQHLAIRRLLLIGRLDEAERLLSHFNPGPFPPALRTVHELVSAGIAMRRLRAKPARDAVARAARAASYARIPALVAEVESAKQVLDAPAARVISRGEEHAVLLDEVETLFASDSLVVDACRYTVRGSGRSIPLVSRPILFAIVRVLAQAWPHEAARHALIAKVFRVKHADESLRARLRVEIGRIRKLLRPLADIEATADGFVLATDAREVAVLATVAEEEHGPVLALLADGESWSSSALALALGESQRTVQRALESLSSMGKVQWFGEGRARRWAAPPVPGFTTPLLLPAFVATD